MRAMLACFFLFAAPAAAQTVEEKSIDQLSAMMTAGEANSATLTQAYLDRIAAEARLNAVIATNPDALAAARASDARRARKKLLGPLDGVPILLKDNIEARELPTTAGSLALKDNRTMRDAPVVARLRAAGAVILGKTNLSEWANIRSSRSMSGWSAVGGLSRNPYALDRTTCGSSGGSGAAVAASLAAAALGTETNGSVVCPSSMNGLVGMKPTVGLVSAARIVPISHSQDTAGPMARTVRDAALLLSAMVEAPRDYAGALSANALKGKRVAVLRPAMSPDLTALFDRAIASLKAAGAIPVEVKVPRPDMGDAPLTVLLTELKVDLNAYLATTPPAVKNRTLADVIAFDDANAATEMPYFAQELFIRADATKGLTDPDYVAARAKSLKLASDAIEGVLTEAGADFYVAPTTGAAWLSDPVHGDTGGGPSASSLPAIAGWPHLTVPMGLVGRLPVGLSFIGRANSEAMLLGAGFAFEQQAKARVAPGFVRTIAGP